MTYAPGRGPRQPSNQEALSLEIVSGLLMLIGCIAVGWLIVSIIRHPDIERAVQGPEFEGLGAEIRLMEPTAAIDNQARFFLEVDRNSSAQELGIQDGDLLLHVGDIELDPATQTEDDLEAIFSTAFTEAVANGETSVPITVYRDGGELSFALAVPVGSELFELGVPITGDTDDLFGLEYTAVPADDLSPYYAIFPYEGSPSFEIEQGSRLVAIDETPITTDLSLAEVRALARDGDVDLEDEDFRIGVEYSYVEIGEYEPTEEDRTITKQVAPTLGVAILDNFGFVIPLLTLWLSFVLIRMGIQLRQYELPAARWAMVVYLWLSLGLLVVAIQRFALAGKGGSLKSKDPFAMGDAFIGALPWLLAIIPLAMAYYWLSTVVNIIFTGEETLSARDTRFAWTLLIPTLAVLIVVAARPLEQTFIKSLTDDIFGDTRPVRFVGLDNYQKLLDFRITTVECRIDEETGECARARGIKQAIQWERSEYEDRRGAERYQEAMTIRMPGSDTKGVKVVAKDPEFINSFVNTMRFSLMSVVLELLIGLVIALVVNSNFAGRGLMRTAMLVPWAIPTVVAATLWQVMLRPDGTGIVNKFLMDIGLIDSPQQWLTDLGPWMNSIVAIDVWKTSPFMALLLLAGLQTIPSDVYEAAAVDGASKIRQFFQITLPLLRPTIAVALIFRTLDALRVFDVFQVLLDPTRPSMATYNFTTMVDGQRQVGYASAVGVLMFIFIFLFTMLYVRFVGLEQEG